MFSDTRALPVPQVSGLLLTGYRRAACPCRPYKSRRLSTTACRSKFEFHLPRFASTAGNHEEGESSRSGNRLQAPGQGQAQGEAQPRLPPLRRLLAVRRRRVPRRRPQLPLTLVLASGEAQGQELPPRRLPGLRRPREHVHRRGPAEPRRVPPRIPQAPPRRSPRRLRPGPRGLPLPHLQARQDANAGLPAVGGGGGQGAQEDGRQDLGALRGGEGLVQEVCG